MSDAWERRLKLLAHLMRRGYAQTAEIARYLGVDRRKAREDLAALAEHGVPLSAHPEDTRDPDRTWQLERSWRMTGLEVGLSERLALLLGREVLEPLVGGSELGLAMTHLEHELASIAGGVETTDRELMRRFHFVQEPTKSYRERAAMVSDLVSAIAFPFRVTLHYRAASAKAAKVHARVRPLTLAIYRRGLYLFVMTDNDRVLLMSVDRIESLTPHPEDDFDYPTRGKWDPAVFLARRFGLQPGTGHPQRVRLRFPPESRAYALERRWMPDQSIEEHPGGAIDILFDAEGDELPYRVLEWGGYCEVIEPETLRQQVLALGRAVVARHEGPAER